jgi:diacylglycerol kinase family enzyme
VRCVLIYNPASGRNRHLHREALRQISEALSNLGHSAELTPTTAPYSAGSQARKALLGGADIVFACGGDGTIHEVLQGLVSENGEPAGTLGIIPFGSANALARHLRLSLDPMQAALQEVHGVPHAIPIGAISYGSKVRYFTVMAGAGPDGALVYNLLTSQKSSLGRMAYYIHAARLFATRGFHPFDIEFTRAASGTTTIERAVSAMATRVDEQPGIDRRRAFTAPHPAWAGHALTATLVRSRMAQSQPLQSISQFCRGNHLCLLFVFAHSRAFPGRRGVARKAPHASFDDFKRASHPSSIEINASNPW